MATNLTLGTTFTADIQQFLQGINQIKQSLNSLQQSFVSTGSGASAMGKGLANAINSTTTAINKQNQAIRTQQGQLTGLAGMWQRVQQAMKTSIAYGTAGAIIYEIIDGLKAGIMTIAEYDQALKNLQAITQATDAEMVGLADTIKEVSSKYIFSTKEISDGAVLMGQAGFTATQTMQAMDAATKLAMGTLEDMSLTVDLLTTTIVSFSMSTVESGRVADVMANAMNRSKLTLDKLRVAFNYVGNIAHEAGISIEETAAAMSVMANAGMRASTIGTSLRQVLQNVLAPNRRLREEFQAMGISLSDLDPKMVGFSGVLQNLRRILIDQKTGLVDMTKAYTLFGLRAAQAAAILARSADDTYPRMLAMMYEVGAATRMADKQMEGLIARFKNLAVNAQLIAIALGEGGLFGVFSMIVDGLTLLTKAVKAFTESATGKFVTSWVAWTLATMGAIKVATMFYNLIKLSMIPALISWISYIRDTVIVMMALQGVSAMSKFNMFLSALTGGLPLIVAYAAAIGGVIAVMHLLRDSEEENIKATTRTANAFKTAGDTLDAYIGVFTRLREKQKQGQNIDVEYQASIKRLLQALPQLKGIIDENTGALDKNIAEMVKYKDLAFDKHIEEQIKLIAQFNKQLEGVTGLKDLTEQWLGFSTGISKVNKDLVVTDESFYELSAALDKTQTSTDQVVDSFGKVVKSDEAVEEQSKKTKAALEGLDAAYVDIALTYKDKLGKSVEFITKKLNELGATPAQIKLAQDAMKSFRDEVSQDAEDISRALANMPHAFTPLFNTLDAMAKVTFAKALSSMEKEVAEYEKIAKTIVKSEEDKYAALAFIRTQALMKFIDTTMKEKVTAEQLIKAKQALVEEEKRLTAERIDTEIKLENQKFEALMSNATKNNQSTIKIEEAHVAKIIELRKKQAQSIIGIEQGANAAVTEAYKKTADEVVKTGQKMVDDYLTQLQRMVDESKRKIEQLKKQRVSVEEDLNDKIRNLKQKEMSDGEKYSDDQTRVNELLGKARDATYTKSYEEAKKYYDKAADLAQSLSREVKDAQGEVLTSEKTTTDTALRYLETIKAESVDLYDRQIADEKKKSEEAKSLMLELTDLLKGYGGEWDKLNQTKLKAFISALDQIIGRTETLSEKTSNMRKDWETITGKLQTMPAPKEPSLGAQGGITGLQKKEGGGTIEVGGKTYEVNEYAGAGGTIGVGGKTYEVGGYAGGGEGTIEVGGKKFDVAELADYENKVRELSDNIQTAVKESQETVIKGAEESGKQAVQTIEEVGKNTATAIEQATSGVETAVAAAKTAETSIGDVSSKMSEMSGVALDINNKFVEMGFNLSTVKNAFTEIQNIIAEIAKTPLAELITQGALDILNGVKDSLTQIKKDWDSLESKEITLTINQQGGVPAGMGGGEGGGNGGNLEAYNAAVSDFGGGFSASLEYRKGGLIGRLNDFFQTVKQYAGGGKLPGYGGGDKQIIAAESGEFVVNKESTSKFLPLIQAINTNSVSDFGKRFGGMIRRSMAVPAYAGGGAVHAMATSRGGGITVEKIIISPTYMSGDRASARRFATEINRELGELNKRLGVKK